MANYGYGTPTPRQDLVVSTNALRPEAGSTFHRDQFERMLAEHGIWVVYLRRNHSFPCQRCNADPDSGQGKSDCTACFGLGSTVSIERRQIVLAKGRQSIPRDTDFIPGYIPESSYKAYFNLGSAPQTGDVILEVQWNVTGRAIQTAGDPVDILHAYTLEQVEYSYFSGAPAYYFSTLDQYDHHLRALKTAIAARRRE